LYRCVLRIPINININRRIPARERRGLLTYRESPMSETARRSAERFNNRNRLANAKNRPRTPVQ